MIEPMFEEGTYIQGLIYHWILFVGIFICFFIYGYIKDGMIADSLSKMGGYSFFVYCVHMLLVNPVHRVVEYAMGISSASYIVSFLLISSWSLLLAWLVNKYFTKAFKILIGGR